MIARDRQNEEANYEKKNRLGSTVFGYQSFLEARWSSYSLEGDDPFVFEAVMRCWMKANEGLSAVTGETHKLPRVSMDCGWGKGPEVGPKVTHAASPQCVVTSYFFGMGASVWGDFWFKMTTKMCKITTMSGPLKTPCREAKERRRQAKETKNDKNKWEIIASTQWAVYRCVSETATVLVFFSVFFCYQNNWFIDWDVYWPLLSTKCVPINIRPPSVWRLLNSSITAPGHLICSLSRCIGERAAFSHTDEHRFGLPALFCLTSKRREWSCGCQTLRHAALQPYHLWHAELSGWETLSTPALGWWLSQDGSTRWYGSRGRSTTPGFPCLTASWPQSRTSTQPRSHYQVVRVS